jgi:2,3-bisphosphoglycerate-dependent phosphoglycerate mutase
LNKIILLRHGQSVWNRDNRFTGWTDVDLSQRGIDEARDAGVALKEAGFEFDLAFTSCLKRAVRTLWLVMEELEQMYLPVDTDWRLNERHYGALQGLDKRETVEKHGAEKVQQWRRGYAVRPPALPEDDPRHPRHDARYAGIDPPGTESLSDTLDRVIPYWNEKIVPQIKEQKRMIISAHGNSLRALVKYLDNVSSEDIMELNIPTGIPLIYELDEHATPIKHYYLADENKLNAAVHEIANQTATE